MTAYATPTMLDPTAVMGRRIGAYFIDAVVGIVVFLAIFIPLARGHARSEGFATNADAQDACAAFNRENGIVSDSSTSSSSSIHYKSGSPLCLPIGNTAYFASAHDVSSLIGELYLIGALVAAANLLLIQAVTGGSIGKLMVGIRVVRHDGRHAGIGWIALRWLLLVVDGFCCGIVGLVTAFSSKGHRRVGDMAASTLVVHKSAVGQPISVPDLTTGYGTQGYGTGYPPPGYAPPPGGAQAYGPPAYGAPPAAPGSWSPPVGAPTSAPPAAPSGEGPQWDEARNAYIQYDRTRSEWVQWDDSTNSWGPISQ